MNRIHQAFGEQREAEVPKDRTRPIRSAPISAPSDRAHAADHGDDEGLDQDRESHAGRQRAHRRRKRAGKARQHAAERRTRRA